VKLVEQLRKRLDAAQVENEQLEEMLKKEETRAVAEATAAKRLAEELSRLQVLHPCADHVQIIR
jgi:ATP-dependent Lon protease